MEILLFMATLIIIVTIVLYAHYQGYKQGRKQGFEAGKAAINDYALKLNRAQNERIKQLMSEKNEEIEKIARILSDGRG